MNDTLEKLYSLIDKLKDETNALYYLIGKILGKSADEIIGDAIKFYRDAIVATEKANDRISSLCVVYDVNHITSKSKWSALENVERELDDEFCE